MLTADYALKQACGIYEIENTKGRRFYKIFADETACRQYLNKHKDRHRYHTAVYTNKEYKEYPHTEIRKLTDEETEEYLRNSKR